MQPQRKPLRHSKMFFAAFSLTSSSELVPLEGDPLARRHGVTGRIILECLKEHLPEIPDPDGITFQHDNGSTFRAKIVQNWLKGWARREGVILVDWPPYSPDLNPIENLWKILKERICSRYPDLATLPVTKEALETLITAAQEVWADIEDEVFENLINSMPGRIQSLYDANGYYTKY